MSRAKWQGPLLFAPRLPPATCELSACSRYRYLLRIPLSLDPRVLLFVMANPSQAIVVDGAFKSDNTVDRCIDYGRRWGYGTLVVTNARAWRETHAELVPEDPEAIGPDNDVWIERAAGEADLVVCGWGKLGGARGPVVLDLIRKCGKVPHALVLNQDGSPSHPLYLKSTLVPFAMPERR